MQHGNFQSSKANKWYLVKKASFRKKKTGRYQLSLYVYLSQCFYLGHCKLFIYDLSIQEDRVLMTHQITLFRDALKANQSITVYNTLISPNFLVWKFSGNVQFQHSFRRIAQNSGKTVPFRKISTTGNKVRIQHFMQCMQFRR